MDKGTIYKRFENQLNREYINSIIDEFELIREKIYLDGNPTEIVSQYLNHQIHISSLQKQINQITNEISVMKNRMVGMKNNSINQLRKENKLIGWLNNLSTTELNHLKEVVNIKNEFIKIDRDRFIEKKSNNTDKVIVRM